MKAKRKNKVCTGRFESSEIFNLIRVYFQGDHSIVEKMSNLQTWETVKCKRKNSRIQELVSNFKLEALKE